MYRVSFPSTPLGEHVTVVACAERCRRECSRDAREKNNTAVVERSRDDKKFETCIDT